MIENIGFRLFQLPIKNLTWVRDLIYVDGPFLSEFNSEGDIYLYHWCDMDETYNRWIIFRVNDIELLKYEYRLITLYELIKKCRSGYVYVVDIAGSDEVRPESVMMLPVDDLPDDYLPKSNSYYSSCLASKSEHTRLSYPVFINGEWGNSNWSEFPKCYKEVYSFLYFFRTNSSPLTSYHPFTYDWGGHGWTADHFFNALHAQIPKESKYIKMRDIKYASPGMILNSMDPEMGPIITSAIHQFSRVWKLHVVMYRPIHNWSCGRSDMSPGEVKERLLSLIRAIGFIDWDKLWLDPRITVESVVHAVLTYYRRIKTLAKYSDSGLAIFV